MFRALPALLLVLLVLVSACDGDSAGDDPTATAPVSNVTLPPDATATRISKTSIRGYDFEGEASLADFLRTAGDVELQIGYTDVTQDGTEDAVILVSSLGTGGYIAAFVYRGMGDDVEQVLRVIPESGAIVLNVVSGGTLIAIEPIYADGDPLCCPSAERHTTYTWGGDTFAVTDERTEQVPP